MTTPNGNIIFNASTGSDTHASGLGPSTAVPFTLQTTAGSNIATVSSGSFVSISIGDLMFIPDVLFTGRKFNIVSGITPVTNEITFDNNWDDTSSSTTGYVGGKRATLDNADSRRLTSGESPQTWIELETDQTITSALGGTSSSTQARIKSSDSSNKTLTISGAGQPMFDTGTFYLRRINTKALDNNDFAYADTTAETTVRASKCIIGDPDYPFENIASGASRCSFDFAESTIQDFVNSSGDIAASSNQFGLNVRSNNCIFKRCGRMFVNGRGPGLHFKNCIFIGTGGDFASSNYGFYTATNCVFYNYNRVFIGAGFWDFYASNCIFHTVVDPFAYIYGSIASLLGEYWNIFQYNVTGSYTYDAARMDGFIGQPPSSSAFVNLTEDPFVDVENEDFNLNDKIGGGAEVKSALYSV